MFVATAKITIFDKLHVFVLFKHSKKWLTAIPVLSLVLLCRGSREEDCREVTLSAAPFLQVFLKNPLQIEVCTLNNHLFVCFSFFAFQLYVHLELAENTLTKKT